MGRWQAGNLRLRALGGGGGGGRAAAAVRARRARQRKRCRCSYAETQLGRTARGLDALMKLGDELKEKFPHTHRICNDNLIDLQRIDTHLQEM